MPSFIEHNKLRTIIKYWLFAGLVLVFFQVVIGGITRLTGSGLSITKWEIITGSIPPIGEAAWNEAFSLYKDTPQYEKINKGMSMEDFKFIYFWEYFHRLWARSMGFIFLFPFLFFFFKGWFSRKVVSQLGVVILLAVIVASFGWIMVASGLIDRPWVNAYKLTFHLSLALILYGYLFWTFLSAVYPNRLKLSKPFLFKIRRWTLIALILLSIQIFVGGIVSGMKAGLFYPTFPGMNGSFIPPVVTDISQWNLENVINYDKTGFMAGLIQFIHRNIAYLLTGVLLFIGFKLKKEENYKIVSKEMKLLITMLVIQVILGILTVINCVGQIPVLWGVLHQAGAICLLSALLLLRYRVIHTDVSNRQ